MHAPLSNTLHGFSLIEVVALLFFVLSAAACFFYERRVGCLGVELVEENKTGQRRRSGFKEPWCENFVRDNEATEGGIWAQNSKFLSFRNSLLQKP